MSNFNHIPVYSTMEKDMSFDPAKIVGDTYVDAEGINGDLIAVKAPDHAMHPVIAKGDVVVVEETPDSEGVSLVFIDDKLTIRDVRRYDDCVGLSGASNAPAYPYVTVKNGEVGNWLKIVGKVVYVIKNSKSINDYES